jgi:HAMP domain-containing protein/DNA-directed RNA polymerase subunit RPC12/RpoP
MLEFTCNGCGKQYRVNIGHIKTRKAKITCKSCGRETLIDTTSPSPSSIEQIDPAMIESIDVIPKAKASNSIGLTKSLKIQINALIVCLVVIVMGGYAGFNYYSAKAKMEKQLQYSSDIAAQRLAQHLREPFWALDDDILKQTLASEMLDRQIFAINIIDRDGKSVYMGFKRDDNWQMIPSKNSLNGDYTVRRLNIVRENDKIGAVEVYLTDKFMKEDFQRSMITIAIIVAILVLAIIFFVSLIFQKMIIQPIANLAALADRISMGDLNVEIPIDTNNEIGLLAKSFDRLKTSLKIGMQAFGTNR